MNTLSKVLHCDGCTTRWAYLRNLLLLAAGKVIIDLQVMHLRPDLFLTWSWSAAWLDPYLMIGPWWKGDVPFLVCCTTFAFFAALVWNSVHRARHARIPHWTAALVLVPFVNIVACLVLIGAPQGKRPSVLDLP
jgi:hypothetical protein